MLFNAFVFYNFCVYFCDFQDILNNLDPLATGELDDDDLMLDVDLPEDGLHGQNTWVLADIHT